MNESKNIALYLIVLSVVGYTLNILFQRYLTHHMEAHLYGDFSIGLNVLDIAVTVLLLGTEVSAIRFLPLFDKLQHEKKFIQWNFYFLKKPLFVYMILLFAMLIIFDIFERQMEGFIETLHISILMLFIAPFSVFYGLFLSYLNGKNRVLNAALVDSFAKTIFLFVLFVLILSTLNIKINIDVIVFTYITVYTLLAFITFKIYTTKYKSLDLFEYFSQQTSVVTENSVEWKKVSLEYAFSSVIFLVFLYMDKIILEFVHPDEKMIGYYSILVILVGLFTLISNSLKPIMVPYISSYIEDKNQKNILQSIINKTNFFLFILTLILFLVYLFAGKEILGFFGKHGEYSVVYLALVYLAVSQIFLEVGRLGLRFLLFSGHTKYINKVFLYSIMLLLISGVILTYIYGLYGMIAAHFITSFLYMTAFILKVKKEYSDIKVLSFF